MFAFRDNKSDRQTGCWPMRLLQMLPDGDGLGDAEIGWIYAAEFY